MKEYLKMGDAFPDGVYVCTEEWMNGWFEVRRVDGGSIDESCDGGYSERDANYISHAINSHDELVAEVERLREFERDAMRYRFLRDNCTTQQADSCGPLFVMTIRQKNNPFNVGLSIDEAMNA